MGDPDSHGLMQECCPVSPGLPLHTYSSASPSATGRCCPLAHWEVSHSLLGHSILPQTRPCSILPIPDRTKRNCFQHLHVLETSQVSDIPVQCGFVFFAHCFLGLNSYICEVINEKKKKPFFF